MTTPAALTSAVVSTFDLLTPYLATYVTSHGQPELTHLLTQVTASRATELISVYLRRALTLVFDANPDLWLSATRLKINASEAATLDRAALLQWVREREPQMIAESPLDDLVKKLKVFLRHDALSDDQAEVLRYFREKRNLYVHNGGLADDHFVRYAHDFLHQTVHVGDEVPFTVPDLTTALQACISIVFSVDAIIVQQFPQLGTIDARQFTETVGLALHTIAAGPLGQMTAQQEAEITAAFAIAKSWEGMRRFAIDGALPSTDVLGVYHQQIWSAIKDGDAWFLLNLTGTEGFGPFDSKANAAAHFQTLVETDH